MTSTVGVESGFNCETSSPEWGIPSGVASRVENAFTRVFGAKTLEPSELTIKLQSRVNWMFRQVGYTHFKGEVQDCLTRAFKSIVAYRNRIRAEFVLIGAIRELHNPDFIRAYLPFTQEPMGSLGAIMLGVDLAEWMATIEGGERRKRALLAMDRIFIQMQKLKRVFRDGASPLLARTLALIERMNDVNEITSEEKLHLFAQCILAKGVGKCETPDLQLLLSLKKTPKELLKEEKPFKILAKEVRSEMFPLLSEEERARLIDLTDRYRYPMALYIYASKYKEFESVLTTLVRSVLDGAFHAFRYETEGHPHLSRLPSQVLEKWKAGHPSIGGVVITDEFQEMLQSGIDVESCQSPMDSGEYNRGLIATIGDGKIKMMSINHPKSETIESRMLIRLLLDGKGNPVLFRDPVYSIAGGEDHQGKLFQASLDYAAYLGLDLYEKDDGSGVILQSFGSNMPCEFVEALIGAFDGGVYTLGARLVSPDPA